MKVSYDIARKFIAVSLIAKYNPESFPTYCAGVDCIDCPLFVYPTERSACSLCTYFNVDRLANIPWDEFAAAVFTEYSIDKYPELYI